MKTHLEDLTATLQDDRIICSFWLWDENSTATIEHMEIRPSALSDFVDENYAEDENFPTSLYMVENLNRLVKEYLTEELCAA